MSGSRRAGSASGRWRRADARRRPSGPTRRAGSPLSEDLDAHRFELDGFEILVGRTARENDRLSLRVARPRDLWLHAAGHAGSHVVVRALEGPTGDVPKHVVERAAGLAAWYSKAREAGGKVSVHVCRAADVSKPRGAPAGQVRLKRHDTVRVYARG
ncbi:MAG TPA: NFACT RNA binding domain-containing protein [Longimicrobiales bacterium]|nr:NFACT RNA binding domain-containing protein [Longimicrobiales bacterium]